MLAVAVVAAVLLLGRDGGGAEARRAAVSAYIIEVNTTQQTLVVELERASLAYRGLRLNERTEPGQLARLERAERTLHRLRLRLAALVPPAEALELRRALLRLVDLHAVLASEVTGMARYIPKQAAENRLLAAATKALREDLAVADTGGQQKEAFEAYRSELILSARRLRQASAPDVLEPSRAEAIERLGRLIALARRLGEALEEGREQAFNRLFPRFVQASAAPGTTLAAREAVIAFNRRLAAIGDQRAAVNAQRSRLDLLLR